MSNFLDKSDLNRKDVDNIVSDTLKNCDDGELYLDCLLYTSDAADE